LNNFQRLAADAAQTCAMPAQKEKEKTHLIDSIRHRPFFLSYFVF
jgi:hypothetical protein